MSSHLSASLCDFFLSFKNRFFQDFPGSPVVKTPRFHVGGMGLILGLGTKLVHLCVCAQLLQLCPTLCDPMDYSPPGSSVHGIFPGTNIGEDCACHTAKKKKIPKVEADGNRLSGLWSNHERLMCEVP